MALDSITLKTLAIELAAALPPVAPDVSQGAPLDISSRAKKTRSIQRIADAYNWHSAIVHFLDMKDASYISDLSEPQLDDLLERMTGYVDAAEMGCSLADSLPAY
ncbi:hypothetical protein BCL79_0647 [Stenotrophomonas rhizophila]|uniref:Uncharacterized protein n=1 Tax=Stenotrophomonas rhizophila TaxID=216778 RepID=A0A498CGY7_9GAMM|nr:hypothetical protein [Stenotrophomonas rhizophila]RLK56263.1 hypothetical protein BCL79_0647 [Stenotrophomonas rhizophila]